MISLDLNMYNDYHTPMLPLLSSQLHLVINESDFLS